MSNAVILKLNDLGYSTVPGSVYEKIAEWKSWYQGNVRDFHRYTVRNGDREINRRRYSLGMGKKLCEDWANLLLNEKVQITLEGRAEQAFVDAVLRANNFAVKGNEAQELKAALGTAAYVARVVDQPVSDSGEMLPDGGARIVLDYVTAEHIYPLAWQNGMVTSCAFASELTRGGHAYLYLQIHRKDTDGTYVIENRMYRADNGLLEDARLDEVEGYERIAPTVYTGSAQRQFVIDRLNLVNNLNPSLPTGVAVFANALDVLRGVDIAYDSYVNEFLLGKRRVLVQPSVSRYEGGQPIFDPEDVAYYVLPEDVADSAAITPIDMPLRTAEHNTGIQDQLNLLSSKCGFGETYYRFSGGSVATATQVISENSTMFRTIKKHEVVLFSVIEELCRILLRLGNAAMDAGLDEDVEISIDFDDSIIEDKATEFARDMQLLQAGILCDWEFRAKWLNEDEETAKAALPKMQTLTDGTEPSGVE